VQFSKVFRYPQPGTRVVDRSTTLRLDKRLASYKEGTTDKQCLGDGKLTSNWGRWSLPSLFRQVHPGERNPDLKPGRWHVVKAIPDIRGKIIRLPCERVASYQGNLQLRRSNVSIISMSVPIYIHTGPLVKLLSHT